MLHSKAELAGGEEDEQVTRRLNDQLLQGTKFWFGGLLAPMPALSKPLG